MSNQNFGSFFQRRGLILISKLNDLLNLNSPVIKFEPDEVDKNINISIVPKGTGFFTLGAPDGKATGGDRRGASAVDLQLSRTGASQVASGANSFVVGTTNTAAGANSAAIGSGNSANGASNFVAGVQNTSSQTGSSAIGNLNTSSGIAASCIGKSNTASGNGSHCSGDSNTASGHFSRSTGSGASTFGVQGRTAHSPSQTTVIGDTQFCDYMLRATTTSATPVIATADGAAASASNGVVLSNNSAYAFHGFVVAKQASSTNVAAWEVKGLIVRGANAAATTLTTSSVTAISNVPGWTGPSLSANTTLGSLEVLMTGPAATTIKFNAKISTTEVILA